MTSQMMLSFAIAVSAVIGFVLAYFALAAPARTRASTAEKRVAEIEKASESERTARESLAIEKASADATAGRVPQLQQEVDALRKELETAGKRAVEAHASLEAERKSHAARVEELKRMGVEIEQKFTKLASDVLGKNSESFLNLVSERFDKHKAGADKDLQARQQAIETLIKPIGENLSKFEHKVGEIEKAREGAYRAITEQVRNLSEGQTGLRSETSRLVQALRRPKTRGRWGEYQLRNVLEMAGMTEHVDFVTEQTVKGEDGALRPDVIVHLPGDKSVVVDAKTPLDAYLAAVEASDEETRERHVADHARHVRNHVRELASKAYWMALPVTPDFVVMFIPGEAFFSAAVESDPELFEQAVRDRVLISTPTTLIALIKAIAYGWQQQNLTENTRAVAGLARDLFERIKTFGGHMNDLGHSLRQAVERYNKGVGSLEGRVLPTARKFETLGVAPSGSSIPEVNPIDLDTRKLQATELAASGRENDQMSINDLTDENAK